MRDSLDANYSCGVELALSVLGGKWKVVVLAHLKQGPMRYGELRTRVPKMSEKMLSQRLRELTDLGFVANQDGSYELTESGRELAPVLSALHTWGRAVARANDVRLDYE